MAEGQGILVLVVGPSGAGKDSIIRQAQSRLKDNPFVVFPRRVVTRKPDARAEDHDTISETGFALAVANGDYAVWWTAHGNCYGIPISIGRDLKAGCTVVFNCSRTVIADVQKQYPHVVVADIQVSPDVLVDRIVARGRENRPEAMARVARSVPAFPLGTDVRIIRNDGALEAAVHDFCSLLASLTSDVPVWTPVRRKIAL